MDTTRHPQMVVGPRNEHKGHSTLYYGNATSSVGVRSHALNL